MSTPALRRFVEDELMRAPMVIDMTLQAVFEHLQRGPAVASPRDRQVAGEMILRLGAHRALVASGYVKSLRQQADDEFAGKSPAASPPTPSARSLGGMTLVDDDDVAVDVATSHAMEAIKSVAEAELRELLSYTSALANDMDVARDHNPLRAEAQARALWFAAQGLRLSRSHHLAFMRIAATPFAQALRKNYAAACARLEDQGVEPAAYRTLILPRGHRRSAGAGGSVSAGAYAHRSLEERADAVSPFTSSIFVPSQQVAPAPAPAAQAATQTPQVTAVAVARSTSTRSDEETKLAGLVDDLFETMLTDRRLPAEMQAPLLRLQSCATKAVVLDESVLDRFNHPLWRLIDLIAHEAVIHPGPDGLARELLMRFSGKLIDQLVQETRHGEPLYTWAIERVDRYVAKRLAERLTQNEARIAAMQAQEDRMAADAPVSTLHDTVDVEQLETVPADLMDANLQSEPPDRAMTSSRWLLERRSGDWLKLFRKGQWSYAQLLWPGERGELFLLGDGDSDDCWAIRRSALLALRDSKLVTMAWPRSLVTDATAILLRRAGRAAAR